MSYVGMSLVHRTLVICLAPLFFLGGQARLTNRFTPALNERTKAMSERTHQYGLSQVLGSSNKAMMQITGLAMIINSLILIPQSTRKSALILGLSLNLWGYYIRWRAGIGFASVRVAQFVLASLVLSMVTLPQ